MARPITAPRRKKAVLGEMVVFRDVPAEWVARLPFSPDCLGSTLDQGSKSRNGHINREGGISASWEETRVTRQGCLAHESLYGMENGGPSFHVLTLSIFGCCVNHRASKMMILLA